MEPFYIILAFLIQNSLTETIIDNEDNLIESREILKVKPDGDDAILKEYQPMSKGWMDMFIGSGNNIFPTSSAALMAQATFSDKSPEEQLEEIKNMADEIAEAIKSEMAYLLSYAVSVTDKEDNKECDNKLRKRRSLESPMDSTKLVMRLLKHIKCNNEYQNIAIEKMMTAQEIADKYGIQFTPDTEMLSDLAVAANEQAKEMSDILKDACDLKNVTHTSANATIVESPKQEQSIQTNGDHVHYYNYPYETQIMSPPVYHDHSPVSHRPNFYDYIPVNQPQDYYPYCSIDEWPMTLIQPIDEPLLFEPEVVGEEYEETVSSKVCIDHEEPGMSSVNHVTTYTISEKAHYRTPQIENLPQQMQYYFLLM